VAQAYPLNVIDDLLNTNKGFRFENQLFIQSGLETIPFQENYINIRKAENRIHSIDFIRNLPEVPRGSLHYHEWRIRRKSAQDLLRYLNNRKNAGTILEVGCGNGWLTHLIAASSDYTVVGADVNLFELKQASEAFGDSPNIHFVFGNILDGIFARNSFDVVILAASIQYFNDLPALMNLILSLVKDHGEIHILDSPFYTSDQVPEARRRSSQYFAKLDHPEMEKYYFHHSLDNLKEFRFEVMYDPGTVKNRILRKWFVRDLSPFPWVRVQKGLN
jgi:ubiquinone/menaquinone biosynthesis C-methylase UbiE